MKKNSMLISFEGIDFSGKSTQINRLTKKLGEINKNCVTLREPGGTVIGEKIRDILLDKKADEMTSETELLLYSAARAQLVREQIIPRLKEGYWVILDRFFDSTTAYQGFGRGLSINKIEQITNFAVESHIPDITFYLRLSPEAMKSRKLTAGRADDRLESNRDSFFEKIFSGYEKIANESKDRFRVIDADKPEEEIFSIIWEILSRYL